MRFAVGHRVKQINNKAPGYGRVGEVFGFVPGKGLIRVRFDTPVKDFDGNVGDTVNYWPEDLRWVGKQRKEKP